MTTNDKNFGKRELARARNRGLWLVIWAFVFSMFVNLLMLTGPLFMLQVYDRVLASRSEETLAALFILVAGLYSLMGLMDFARGRVMARFGARFRSALDLRVFDASISAATIPSNRASPSRAMQDLDSVQGLFSSSALLAIMDVPWTPVFLAAIFIFHPMLGWLATGGAVTLILITIVNQLLTRNRVASAQAAGSEAASFAEQARQATEVVRAQGMQASLGQRWEMRRVEALRGSISASDWTGGFAAFTKTLRLFLQSAILALGAWLVLQGEITAGAMIAASILLGRALAPVEQSVAQWATTQRAVRGWSNLGRFLKTVPKEAPATELPQPEARLEVKSLFIAPPGERLATVRNLNFSVEPGGALGVIGRSGSGKTTLARALVGVWQPASGEIRLGGATLDQYGTAHLGRLIGYLPQNVTLFGGTVSENIARMAIEPVASKVVAAAQRANAHEVILSLPKGYDTPVEGIESQLSGGQRQRIGLARALYDDPVLLILDEPNSALDADGSEALNAAIRDFKSSGRTVLIMTHRPMAISECDKLMVLDNGQITALGPRDEILKSMLKNANEVRKTISVGGAV